MLAQETRPASPGAAAEVQFAHGGPRPAPGTLTQLFFDAVREYDKPDAMLHKVGGVWTPIPHRAVLERVRRIALGLQELGVARGDRVAILCENRPEWAMADYGCLTIGAASVPIYPTLPGEQIPHLLNDSGAAVVFVSTPAQAAKIRAIRPGCAGVRHVIGIDAGAADGCDLTLAELEQRGAAAESAERNARWQQEALAVRPDDLATLIYTSGTTGTPKGVMLTHDNFHSNVMAARTSVGFGRDDVALSFLPLSHVFEREGDYMYWSCGTCIAYVTSIDDVAQSLQEVKPTFAMGVPRLYEKMYARVFENAVAGGGLKKKIFFWALGVADRWANEKLAGREPGGMLAWQYGVAQKLVFSKLKERTGGRLRYFVSGGAPLAPEINKFFYAAGIVILEGYGLTETSPVIAVNTPAHFRIGTVGRPIAGVEVKIAPDGEILARGPNIMKGYFNKPEATAEAIDADGWFHTGDIGRLEDGFLRITDRKKDIIVTAGGKNIAPQPIENAVKTCKYVSQCVMIGDKRRFPSLLVVPNWEAVEKWSRDEAKLTWTSRRELMDRPEVRAKMDQEVRAKLDGLASFEMPKKIALLEHDFSIERGELTPKLSVKRKVVDESYRDVIDAMYAEE
ncbi:long-chain fatty acid--CoA ligase [Roseisolibacter sp. H3M3-2]|uniref:AMP-dependent synthetase/ligase n=1 Tax=Roseisolibacter sp. H3M3-2 TaxID=3031323 RepID=UPI0023DB69C0|nr:long-chain fatty acid--CoA ligase [Roseisolibacter sp. H3M3-2]MDF1505355.1 long-chain fatty acid--CoA ligase [Roseisolibacter sp. H3M3-2]